MDTVYTHVYNVYTLGNVWLQIGTPVELVNLTHGDVLIEGLGLEADSDPNELSMLTVHPGYHNRLALPLCALKVRHRHRRQHVWRTGVRRVS